MKREPVKLQPGYVSGKTQLQILPGKKFKMSFDPMSKWGSFGSLEGDLSQFEDFLALHPKTLKGWTEAEITQKAMKIAQETGQQVDLAGVGVLMRTAKLSIGKDGKSLVVTEPRANDPDKHPLAGAVFSSSL